MSSLYMVAMHLLPVGIGMTTVAASAYGLGKYDKDSEAIEYKVSIAFLIIGLIISISTLAMWAQGNLVSGQCMNVIAKTVNVKQNAIECIKERGDLKLKSELKGLEELID